MSAADRIAPLVVLCDGPPPADVRAPLARLRRAPDVVRVAVMPDVHFAEGVCVGCVVATERLIYPEAVGGDLGCGVDAVRTGHPADALASPRAAARLMDLLYARLPALVRRTADAPPLPEGLRARPLSTPALERLKDRDARLEFGTLGRGNHFLEAQADEDGALWLCAHSGSRGVGRAIYARHLAAAAEVEGGLRAFDADSAAARAYLDDLAWAVDYAAQNRAAALDVALAALEDVLGPPPEERSAPVACAHNHVRRESPLGAPWWVHRKGAIPTHQGAPGIVPGSFGSPTYHVVGRGDAASLCSGAHGAGRALARGEARRRLSTRDFARGAEGVFVDLHRAEELLDEAPAAYKDVRRVMRAQRAAVRVVRTLRPVLNYRGR